MLAIVADSGVYLTEREAKSLGVRMIPMSYAVDGRRFVESYGGENGDYAALFQGARQLTTEPGAATAFRLVFEDLLERGFEVLCVVISSRLSGSCRSARQAAQQTNPDRVKVVDSLAGIGIMEFLVRRARELADRDLGVQEIARELERFRDTCGLCFSVEDMAALRRSGRMSLVRQSVGTVLNIRPILRMSGGAIVSVGTARGRSEQAKLLARQIPPEAREVILTHFGPESQITELRRQVEELHPNLALRVKDGGPVLTIHLGVGCNAASWRTE